MSTQTKMIIITSNEDIIKQFSINKNKNTQIIDLDNYQQTNLLQQVNHNNTINLALLSKLSELNSTNDQVFKRALDSPDGNPSKSIKVPKRSSDLVCTICGDRAIGFNYDALSCGSCKAFFRRNANQNLNSLRCLQGDGQCSISHDNRRKCPRCRLNRCLTMGMRKDFILSEEEKQQRKKRLEENRNGTSKRLSTSDISNSESISPPLDDIDRLLMDIEKIDADILIDVGNQLNESDEIYMDKLSVEDWIVIDHVQSSFLSTFPPPQTPCPYSLDLSDRNSALISWTQMANQIALRFISFFRKINQFEELNSNDRFILIKFNLLPLFPLSKCFYYKPTDGCFSNDSSEEAEKHRRFFMLCGASNDIQDTFRNLVLSLVDITEQDPIILSLLMTVLIFTRGLSMTDYEPILNDTLAVNEAQSYYTKLLWHYIVNKWGEIQAYKHFTHLLTIILRIQTVTKTIRELFRHQLTISDSVANIAPIMQSVLHIS